MFNNIQSQNAIVQVFYTPVLNMDPSPNIYRALDFFSILAYNTVAMDTNTVSMVVHNLMAEETYYKRKEKTVQDRKEDKKDDQDHNRDDDNQGDQDHNQDDHDQVHNHQGLGHQDDHQVEHTMIMVLIPRT